MKKIISLLLSLALMCCTCAALGVDSAALEHVGSGWYVTLEIRDWADGAVLEPDSCYFIEKNTVISKAAELPASSVLIISDGAQVRLKAPLRISGALVVHSGCKLNVQKNGVLLMKKDSLGVLNGTLAISRGGKVRNYGSIQSQGKTAVRGVLKNYSGAEYVYSVKPNAYSGGKLSGSSCMKKAGEYPEYVVKELSAALDEPLMLYEPLKGKQGTSDDLDKCRELIHQMEAVIFKAMPMSEFYEIYGGEDELAKSDLHSNFRVQTIPEDGSEPYVFEYNWLGYEGTMDFSGVDPVGCLYEQYMGDFNWNFLFMRLIEENQLTGWSDVLTDKLRTRLGDSECVVLAECIDKDGDYCTFNTLETFADKRAPISHFDGLPEGQFTLSGYEDLNIGDKCILALTSDCTEILLNGVRMSVDDNGNIGKLIMTGTEYVPSEEVGTVDKIRALLG